MAAPTSIHESAARMRKAIALTDVLDAAGAEPGVPITDVQWRLAERAARVRPSSAKTRETVVIMLAERRRLRGHTHRPHRRHTVTRRLRNAAALAGRVAACLLVLLALVGLFAWSLVAAGGTP